MNFYLHSFVYLLCISMVLSCTVTQRFTLPSGLKSIGVDKSNDRYLYLGTTTQSLLYDTISGNYTTYLPSITSVSDIIFDEGTNLLFSTSSNQIYSISGNSTTCLGCNSYNSPEGGLYVKNRQAIYIADQSGSQTTNIRVYNLTTGTLNTLSSNIGELVGAQCNNPKDNNNYFATTGNKISKVNYNTGTVSDWNSSQVGSIMPACMVVSDYLYILDQDKNVIWRIHTSTVNIDQYAGSGADVCTGSFGSDTVVDFATWQNQLLVITTQGRIYSVSDTVWVTSNTTTPSPVPQPTPVPQPSPVPLPSTVPQPVPVPAPSNIPAPIPTPSVKPCIDYNYTGIISYNNSLVLCSNLTVTVISEVAALYWDSENINQIGNIDVINLVVSDSQINIDGDVQILGSLSLDSSTLVITGNLTLVEKSQLIVQNQVSILVDTCVTIDGKLTLNLNQTIKNGHTQTIINHNCYSGEFEDINLQLVDIDPCKSISPQIVYNQDSISVIYNVADTCLSSNEIFALKLTIMIVVPTLLILAVLIGLGYFIYRKQELRNIVVSMEMKIRAGEESSLP